MAKVITVTLNPCLDVTLNLMDFQLGKVNRAEKTFLDAGGKGINVSRALKNFGVENTALGIIGGEKGKTLKRRLDAEGVTGDFLEVSGETRTNYKIFSEATGETTDINEQGIVLHEQDINAFLELYRGYLKGAEYAVLAGSIPPRVDGSIYCRLTEMANAEGVKVILDTSGEALKKGLGAKPYAIKPNIHEFEDLLGRQMKSTNDILSGIKEIESRGIELVTVSMGGDGAIFMQGDIAYKTGVLTSEIKSTVGCGDSVVAGIVYSLVNGFDLKKTAMISAAAGSVTAGKDGTGMCGLDEVMALYGNIAVDRIQFL